MQRIRAILSLVLTLAFFSITFIGAWTVISYQINKEEITKTKCINLNKPALRCHGKCYLKKELQAVKIKHETEQKVSNNVLICFGFFHIPNHLLVLKSILQEKSKSKSTEKQLLSQFIEVQSPPPELG